mgnify:CR=1 FL=1
MLAVSFIAGVAGIYLYRYKFSAQAKADADLRKIDAAMVTAQNNSSAVAKAIANVDKMGQDIVATGQIDPLLMLASRYAAEGNAVAFTQQISDNNNYIAPSQTNYLGV